MCNALSIGITRSICRCFTITHIHVYAPGRRTKATFVMELYIFIIFLWLCYFRWGLSSGIILI